MDEPTSKSSRMRRLFVAAALFAAGWFGHALYDGYAVRAETRRSADAARAPATGFEIELFAKSPEHTAHSMLCLLDGQYGQMIQDGQVFNRNSHVDFEGYTPGSFTAGVQGNDKGQVIDLGDIADLEREVGGPPLEVLRWRDGTVLAEGDEWVVPDPIGEPSRTEQAQRWLATVLKAPALAPAGSPLKAAQVKPGHVYFVRISANREPTEIVALLYVLEYDVNQRVKLRCVQL